MSDYRELIKEAEENVRLISEQTPDPPYSDQLIAKLVRALRSVLDEQDAAGLIREADNTGNDALRLLPDLVDPDDCWFDHRGGCQAHGYLDLKPGELCPQAEAKQLLARSSGVADTPKEVDPTPLVLRDVAVNYLRLPRTTRWQIVRDLGIPVEAGEDDAIILGRVKLAGKVSELGAAVSARLQGVADTVKEGNNDD